MKASVFKKFWRYFKVFFIIKKLGFVGRTFYRLNFSLLIFAVFFQMILSVIFVKTVFSFVQNIAGWSYFESLLVLASYMIVEGAVWMLFGQMGAIKNLIQRGSLDSLLIKPIDTQLLVSAWRGDLEDVSRIFTGLGVLVYALSNLDLSLEFILVNSVFYFFLIINAITIAYSFALFLQTMSFWLIKGYSLTNIQDSILSVSKFPTDIFFNKIVRLVFTFAVPIAFISTVPAKIFSEGFNFIFLLESFAIASLFFWLSRKFWLYALRKYISVGG